MKLLLDENLPKKLKQDFDDHEIYTDRDMGWQGIKNGELLNLLIANRFDALLTFDKNLQHQQNFHKYAITVFIMHCSINTYDVLTNLTKDVKVYLDSNPLHPGVIVIG